MNEKEIWKDIDGYEGWYQVSSFGRVKRLKKVHCNHGKRNIVEREYILNPSKDKKGYSIVTLSNGVDRKPQKVHRLVAEAFIPNDQNKPQVDHINRNKSDNRLENLRWATNSENQYNTDHPTILSAFGLSMSIQHWSETYGIKPETIITRLQRGWIVEDAVTVKPLKEGEYLHGRRKKH